LPHRAGGKLCTSVTAGLGRRIVAGQIGPGEALPTEAALCAEYDVSRTTVREAIKRLQGKGLVAGLPRSGTKVLPTLHWNQFDAELLDWRMQSGMDAALLDQLYEIRDCFEPRACELAATRADAAQRSALRALFVQMATPGPDTEARIAADLAFHLAIFAATGNDFFVSLGGAIRTALHLSFSLSQRSTAFPRRELRLHEDVCAAIERGDGTAAARNMRRLLDASRHTLGLALRHQPESAA
jgi:DNA-binding FadR family transcriptional regulator